MHTAQIKVNSEKLLHSVSSNFSILRFSKDLNNDTTVKHFLFDSTFHIKITLLFKIFLLGKNL